MFASYSLFQDSLRLRVLAALSNKRVGRLGSKARKSRAATTTGNVSGDTVIPAQICFVKVRGWVRDRGVCAKTAAELCI